MGVNDMGLLPIAALHCLLLFACQVFNNTTMLPGTLLLPIGLVIATPGQLLGLWRATALFCLIGTLLDAVYPFVPPGFGATFLACCHGIQRTIFPTTIGMLPSDRMVFEQAVTALYPCFLFIFRGTKFSIYQFATTILLSQLFTLALSRSSSVLHWKIIALENSYARYGEKPVGHGEK
jgi:hypothetical protein